jgi:UDP-N-acetylmuramoyl-tripeptide--D-alanyl-D-alanine ligase
MKSIFKKTISFLLELEARAILNKYKPKIIAVTGSVGKTSTKDAIFSVMADKFCVRKSEKSFNSDIGIPLTILGCKNAWSNPFYWIFNLLKGLEIIFISRKYPEWLILEVGADRPGDIKSVTKWLKPDIVVITKFAKVPVHIEYFTNREEVIREKYYLVEALKRDGILIVNADDEDAMSFADKFKGKKISYGIEKTSEVRASNVSMSYIIEGDHKNLSGMNFRIDYLGSSVPINLIGTVGLAGVYSALSAITVGASCGLNLVEMGQSLINYSSPSGRMKLIEGIKNTTILDDTYNSSPVAITNALNILKMVQSGGRRIAVLGDMMELGKHSMDEHNNAGILAKDSCDILITVGVRARKISEGALSMSMEEKNIYQFDTAMEAGKELQQMMSSYDTILVKGSQSMRMERVVEEIMANPEKAGELLVRQDAEWKLKA